MNKGIKYPGVIRNGLISGLFVGATFGYFYDNTVVGLGIGMGLGALLAYVYLCVKYGRSNLNN